MTVPSHARAVAKFDLFFSTTVARILNQPISKAEISDENTFILRVVVFLRKVTTNEYGLCDFLPGMRKSPQQDNWMYNCKGRKKKHPY